MMHLYSFTAVKGYCWDCCIQVDLLISGICCTSFPSPQWTDMVETVVFRLICLFLVYDEPLFLYRSEQKLLRLLCWGWFTYFWYMLHFSSFTALNGYGWGFCFQVNLLISGKWCTSFPSPQWTDMVKTFAFRLICLCLVYVAPFFFYRSERKLLRLLC